MVRSLERFHRSEWIRSDTPPSIELGGESEFMLRLVLAFCLAMSDIALCCTRMWSVCVVHADGNLGLPEEAASGADRVTCCECAWSSVARMTRGLEGRLRA